ncbi:hypothetical protein N9K77_00570 [bacterium]|nr:hypothetical protein [bacterium]
MMQQLFFHGGAKLMIEDGLLNNKPQACIAQHVYPDLQVGKVGFRPESSFAKTANFSIATSCI